MDVGTTLFLEAVLTIELLLEIIGQLTCDIGLVGLASCCRGLHVMLTHGSPSPIAKRLTELSIARGWREGLTSLRTSLPDGWGATVPRPLRYLNRVRTLPPPHRSWDLDRGRTLRVGSSHEFSTVRRALAAARDGDTVMICAKRLDEGSEPLLVRRSIRLLGGGGAPAACMLSAHLVVTSGQSVVCGIALCLPAGDVPPMPAAPPLPRRWQPLCCLLAVAMAVATVMVATMAAKVATVEVRLDV